MPLDSKETDEPAIGDPDAAREIALSQVAEAVSAQAPQRAEERFPIHPAVLKLLSGYARDHLARSRDLASTAGSDRGLFDGAVSSSADPVPVEGLVQTFREALLTYHRVDGRTDHSGLQGTQFPPVDGITPGDVDSLKSFIDRFSSFLAQQLDGAADYHPIPAGEDRAAFRKEIAAQAAPDIKANALQEFMATVETLQIPKIKAFVKLALQKAQKPFFTAPSSSSGNYHPADEFNFEGLLVHSIRNVVMARLIGKFLGLQPHDQEVADAAEIVHDIDKGGIPWKTDVHGSGYAPDHGPIAADWLKSFEQDCGDDCDELIDAVDKHMAQWNKPQATPPQTLMEQIVSWADYLASLDDVYIHWHSSPPAEAAGNSRPDPLANEAVSGQRASS